MLMSLAQASFPQDLPRRLNGLEECLDGGIVGGRHEEGDLDASAGVGDVGHEVHARRLVPGEVDGLPGVPADGYIFSALVAVALRVSVGNCLSVLRGAHAKGDDFVAVLNAIEEDFGHVAIAPAACPYVVALGRVSLEPRKSTRSSTGLLDSFCSAAPVGALPPPEELVPLLQPIKAMLRVRAATHTASSFLEIFMGPRPSMCISFRPMGR